MTLEIMELCGRFLLSLDESERIRNAGEAMQQPQLSNFANLIINRVFLTADKRQMWLPC